ncbi:MAG: flagellar motor switch protein FliN [Bdellovibrionales bacterium]|nr:flagellar motor switch protein FliN [Bdellovibrionales bacterium]
MAQKYEQNEDTACSQPTGQEQPIEFLHDVSLEVRLEYGRTEITIGRLLELKKGSVLELDRTKDDPLRFYVNGKCVAAGEVVVLNDSFGVRITSIVTPLGFEE